NKGRTGAAKGPKSIRKELANLPCQFPKDILLFDAGDVLCNDSSLEEAQEVLGQAVERILELNLFPILLGGGHEIAFGHYKGILNYLQNINQSENIGIINFDAHFDLRPYPKGGTSGTMFKEIADLTDTKNINFSYLCLGIQEHANTVKLFDTADKLGVEYVLAKDLVNMDYYSMIEKLDDFIKDQEHIYVTICSDVFSSAFAPGVSSPQALGLDPKKVLIFLKYILRSKKTISFDIAEVSPRFDLDSTTANLASVLIFSVVNTLSKII
ncbi:MAG TPA: formimidoylglutamase, partial [Tissierellaceae bacterium]|nr:formimidoylglutamase [Tissierellaceae bacterium]